MGQKRLANVAIAANWTTLVGALEGALRALGEPQPTHTLMGITGHAFRTTVTEATGVIAAAPAGVAVDFARVLPLYRNSGRTLELVTSARDRRDFPKRRERALKQIRKSIDRGRPAIVYDIHIPEFGLVSGYDDRARTLTVSSLMSAQYGETLPESRWPVPERGEPLAVLLIGDRARVDPTRALREALRFAVEHAEQGEPGDPTGATHGLAALGRWAEAFERGAPIDASGNARLVQTVQTARRDAARFLRETASTLRDPVTSTLNEAAAVYDRVALTLSQMATLFPYPSGGDVEGPGPRLLAGRTLREVERREREAVRLLREALPLL